jgi:hypothetical protein
MNSGVRACRQNPIIRCTRHQYRVRKIARSIQALLNAMAWRLHKQHLRGGESGYPCKKKAHERAVRKCLLRLALVIIK